MPALTPADIAVALAVAVALTVSAAAIIWAQATRHAGTAAPWWVKAATWVGPAGIVLGGSLNQVATRWPLYASGSPDPKLLTSSGMLAMIAAIFVILGVTIALVFAIDRRHRAEDRDKAVGRGSST